MSATKQKNPDLDLASLELTAFSLFCCASLEANGAEVNEADPIIAGLQALTVLKPGPAPLEEMFAKHPVISTQLVNWQNETSGTRERWVRYAGVCQAAAKLKKPADPKAVLRAITYRPSTQAYVPGAQQRA